MIWKEPMFALQNKTDVGKISGAEFKVARKEKKKLWHERNVKQKFGDMRESREIKNKKKWVQGEKKSCSGGNSQLISLSYYSFY
jgi:hypothetical protein